MMRWVLRRFFNKLPWRWMLLPAIALMITGMSVVYYGRYNVSALTGHTDWVYQFLEYARIRAVKVRAPTPVPNLDALDWQGMGFSNYEKHCLKCHGAPGIAPEAFSLGMMPPPSAIVRVARNRSPEELYWVIENGIKMSGMPAWKYRLSDREIWSLVAFLKKSVVMTKAEYLQLRAGLSEKRNTLPSMAPDLEGLKSTQNYNGRVALQQYNCSSCHVISGMPAADYHVGPPLTGILERSFIAGILPMTRENLIDWIMNPARYKPNSIMPDLNVSREHAQLMVEYLAETSP